MLEAGTSQREEPRALDLAVDAAAVGAVLHQLALLQQLLESGLPLQPLRLRAAQTDICVDL